MSKFVAKGLCMYICISVKCRQQCLNQCLHDMIVLDSKVKVESVLSSVFYMCTNTDINCTVKYVLYVVCAVLARIEMQGSAFLCYMCLVFFFGILIRRFYFLKWL